MMYVSSLTAGLRAWSRQVLALAGATALLAGPVAGQNTLTVTGQTPARNTQTASPATSVGVTVNQTPTAATPGRAGSSAGSFGVLSYALLSHVPAQNASNVPVNTSITLTFNEPPTGGTIVLQSDRVGGRRSLGPGTVSGNTATYTLPAGTTLQPGELVRVSVPATVLSAAGAALPPITFSFTTATVASSGTFGPDTQYSTPTDPRGVALGDMNGDSRPDLVTVNYASNSVTVRPALAAGGFGAATNFTRQTFPTYLAVADATGDGLLDAITVTEGALDYTAVVPGNGSGGLGTPNYLSNGNVPRSAVVADVNADGIMDVVTVGGLSGAGYIHTALGTGTGTFASYLSTPTTDYTTKGRLGDMNNDGILDMVTSTEVLVTGNGSGFGVQLGTGTGTFGPPAYFGVGAGSSISGMTLADMNGDGNLDVVTTELNAAFVSTVDVFRGTGSGAVLAPLRYPSPSFAEIKSLTVGDLNGDGRPDVIASHNGSPNGDELVAFLQTPTGGFDTRSILYGTLGRSRGMELADLNGDGRLDLAVLNGGGSNNLVQVFYNQAVALPYIDTRSPFSGPVGTVVTLTGIGLSGATSVTLNGQPINAYTVNTAGTVLTFTVPAGASTGLIVVATPVGTATTSGPFTVTLPQLAVSQGSTAYPNNGTAPYAFASQTVGNTSAATTFTLTNAGTGDVVISSVVASGDFAVSGTAPTTVAAGGTASVAVVFAPTAAGTRTGSLVITSNLGTYTVALTGTGTAAPLLPVITSFSPSSGPPGTVITVVGANFTGLTTILLGGGLAGTGSSSSVQVQPGGGSFTFVVPIGSMSGVIRVFTPTGSATSTGVFTVTAAPPVPANDQCAGAVLLTMGTTVCTPTAGTVAGATQQFAPRSCNALLSSTAKEVWYSFVARGSTATVNLTSAFDGGMDFISGSCLGFSYVSCANAAPAGGTEVMTLTGLFAGNTYYVRVYPFTTAATPTPANGTFSICVFDPASATLPTLTSIVPAAAAPGTTITLSGTNLTGATDLDLNGQPITGFVVNAAGTAITFTVPAGASAGLISVTTPLGTATTSGILCVQYTPTGTGASRCGSGSLTLTARGAATGSFNPYRWYTQPVGGTASLNGSNGTLLIPGLSATTTYYVAISTGTGSTACEGPRTAVVATINTAPAPPTVTQVPFAGGSVFSSSAPAGNQWYLNGAPLPGATGQTYTATGTNPNDLYSVTTTSAAGCTSLPSMEYAVLLGTTGANGAGAALTLHPNPAHSTCVLTGLPATAGPATATLHNALGQLVRTVALAPAGGQAALTLAGLPAGVYAVRVQAGGLAVVRRLVVE